MDRASRFQSNRLSMEYPSSVARPKTDDDAAKNLREGDKTQDAPRGRRSGCFGSREGLGDGRKIAKREK